jgi:hypothetical protein
MQDLTSGGALVLVPRHVNNRLASGGGIVELR